MFVDRFCVCNSFLKTNLIHYLRSGFSIVNKKAVCLDLFCFVSDVVSRYPSGSAFRITLLCILKKYLFLNP